MTTACRSNVEDPQYLIKNPFVAKVFITAPFTKRRDVRRLAEEMRSIGYEVTSKWQDDVEAAANSFLAARNLLAIVKSDVLVVVGAPVGRKMSYDMGFARACGLRVLYVACEAHELHLYDTLPHESYATEGELLRALHKVSLFKYKRPKEVPNEDYWKGSDL